jgi:hypothetical protein
MKRKRDCIFLGSARGPRAALGALAGRNLISIFGEAPKTARESAGAAQT